MEKELRTSRDSKFIPMTSLASGKGFEAKTDVYYYTNQIVNLVFVGSAEKWFLVDAGMPQSAEEIIKVAEKRFGEDAKPEAIFLTHGHFDHVGSVVELIEKWNVPVYAHREEFPHLTGERAYPEPDSTVEGGLLAKIAALYPNEPIDIEAALKTLPDDHTLPGFPDWQWIYTPGHSDGHVSFFREADRLLISGDAVVTVRQDSFYRVLLQKKEINGPPRYFTNDWNAAFESVKKLRELMPNMMVSGHGKHMEGKELSEGLDQLAAHFEKLAVPDYGKFVNKTRNDSAQDE
jgi:glyoxylase-like metal-dependent hydrolase (beta-lactamase superfamily II)